MTHQRALSLFLVILVAGCGTTPPPQPSGRLPQPSPVTSEPDDSDDGWQLVATGSRAAATQFRGVAVTDREFVAVGSSGQAGEIAMAWSSPDGATWAQEDITSRGTSPDLVLPWGDRFFAFGGGSSARCAHPGEIDTWVRDPAGTWTEAPFDPLFCAGRPLTPVFHERGAWLLGTGFGEVPIALESSDGLRWTDHRDALGDVFIDDAAADDDGLWIAERSVTTGEWRVRSSDDGRRWEKVRLPAVGISGSPKTIVIDGHVALLAPTDTGFLRLTRIGAAWEPEPVTGLDGFSVLLVRPAGSGVVALATTERGAFALLFTADGTAWHQVSGPVEAGPEPFLLDVAVGQGQVVLVGQVPPPSEREVAVGGLWLAPQSILER